jgi:hypothetical protein
LAEIWRSRAPTDAEIAVYTSDKADGDWLYVLENAIGQHREDFSKLHRVSEPNDDALVGGGGATAVENNKPVKPSPVKPGNAKTVIKPVRISR